MKIIYDKVAMPKAHSDYLPVNLTAETMKEHRLGVLKRMREKGLDVLLIYADREHGGNYAYLTGFEPRFEESVLVLHGDGACYLLLGNENLKMCAHSYIEAELIPVPHFSLPCQPMENTCSLPELFKKAGISGTQHIGCVGWKLFTSSWDDNEALLDIPSFIIDAVRENNQGGSLCNAAGIFLDPAEGLRVFANANEIAHFEYGAGVASTKILNAINAVQPGKTELEIADLLACGGQPVTVTTICAAGERFTDAVVFPRNRKIALGEKFSVTMGLRGGLTCRASYAAYSQKDLPVQVQDYLDRVAKPYYRAAVGWYEMVGIDTSCGAVYKMVEELLPKKDYHWVLNPGHSTGSEEWISSPMYSGSKVSLKSGMMLQMDIIPSVPGYGGANAEDGIAIADGTLRSEIEERYPDTWRRIQKRRRYMLEELHIELKEEILPLSDICGYLRPFLLDHTRALKKAAL